MDPVSQTQYDQLLATGQITPEQYDQFTGAGQGMAPAAPMPTPMTAPAPMSAPAPAPAPVAAPADPLASAQPLPPPASVPPPSEAVGSPDFLTMFRSSSSPEKAAADVEKMYAASGKAIPDDVRERIDTMKSAGKVSAKENEEKLKKWQDFKASFEGVDLNPEQQERLEQARLRILGPNADEIEGLSSVTADAATPPLATDVSFTGDPTKDVPAQQGWDTMGYPAVQTPGLDMQQAAVLEAAKLGEQKAAAEGAHLREAMRQQEELTRLQEQERVKEQERLETAAKEVQAATDELGSAKVEPGRMWANMETHNKILAIIGLIMGAFDPRGNKAVDVMQRAIETDVKAQMADIETRKAQLGAKQNAYQMMRQRFGDADIARKAATAAGWQRAELQLQEIATRYQGKEQGAKALAALGEIQARKDAIQAEVIKDLANKRALAEGNFMGMDKEQRERFVPGYGLALTKDDAAKLREKVGTVNNSKQGIRDLLAISEKPGKSLSPEERAKAQTIANMLKGSLRTEIVGPGAMSESEIAIMDNIIRDPTKITSLDSSNKAALQTLMKRLDSSLESDMKARGLTPPREQLGITARDN